MNICPVCKNREFTKDGLCIYCLWKGIMGPGKLAKEIIKNHNNQVGDIKCTVKNVE